MTNNITGNPALRAEKEKEAKQKKAAKVSTFDMKAFWKDIKSRFKKGIFGAGILISFGLAIGAIIWLLKYFNIAKEYSVVGSIKMSSLMESMFHVDAPLLFGAIMYGILFVLFTMKDSTIALAIKLYDLVFATAIAAVLASIVIMSGHSIDFLTVKPNWLALWSMTLNYIAVALFAVKFIFVSTGMEKSPNRGKPIQYFGLILGYFGGGSYMIYTSLNEQAFTVLGIFCAVLLLLMFVAFFGIGRKEVKKDPLADTFFGAVSMCLVATLYAGLLYIACNIPFSTKEILCSFNADSLANECMVFQASLSEW